MKRQSQVLLVLVFISFLGLGVAGLGTNYFKLKPELQPLSVSISTDKDYYRPGQTIDIDVRVVDPATREPIKDVYVEIWIMPCEDCFDVSPIGVLKGRTDENGGASFQYRIKECEACGDTYTCLLYTSDAADE